MKKWICFILFILLAGCSKSDDPLDLQPRTLNYEYGQKVFFRMDDFLDLTDYSQNEIDELEKTGEIDTSNLVYDEQGNIKVGIYKIKVTYKDQVVYSTLNIEDVAIELFKLTDLYEIEVQIGDQDYDFSKDVTAVSIYDSPINVEYDTEEVDFDQPGSYPLYLIVTDDEGHEVIHTYTVVIVENDEVIDMEENTKKEDETSAESKKQGTATSNQAANDKPAASTNNSKQDNNNTSPVTNTTPAENETLVVPENNTEEKEEETESKTDTTEEQESADDNSKEEESGSTEKSEVSDDTSEVTETEDSSNE